MALRLTWLVLTAVLALVGSGTAQAAPGWAPAGNTTGWRSAHTATLLDDGRVVVAGGPGPSETAEVWDPATGAWWPLPRMITRRYAAQAALLEDGTVLMAGGTGGQPVNAITQTELYDPRTNSWSATGSLNFPRTVFTATRLLDGRVLAVGGVNGMNTALRSAEIYDPSTWTWKVVAAPASPRFNHSAVLLPSGNVMVMGGGDTQPGGPTLSSTEIYDPVADTWTPGAGMTVEREAFAASLLPTGGVLAVGGDDDLNRQLSSAEILSADGLAWTPAREMAARRKAPTATRLVNGDVLVVGGLAERDGDATTSTEVFDTSTGSWRPAGDLATPRAYHTATLLRDGRVLVVGGIGAPAEIWTPATTLAVAPAVDLGVHAVGSTTTSEVQVTNTGDQPLLLSDVTVGGDFAMYGDGCRVAVYPGGTCALGIRFTPTAPGPRSARLTFGDNTAAAVHAVVLSGLGVAARIRVSLSYRYRFLRHRTRLLSLVVKRVPAGATVKATCSRHCSRRSVIRSNTRPVVSLRALIRRPLRPGTVITVVVSRPGEIAAVKRLTIRARRKPRLVTRCLPPGAVKPRVCR